MGPQAEVGPLQQFWNQDFQTAETRHRVTSVVTRPAKVAGSTIPIRLAEHRKRIGQHRNTEFVGSLLNEPLAAARPEWWKQILPDGCVVNFLCPSCDSNQSFDSFVVRGYVIVADRPVVAPAILQALGFEIQRAKTIAVAPPK